MEKVDFTPGPSGTARGPNPIPGSAEHVIALIRDPRCRCGHFPKYRIIDGKPEADFPYPSRLCFFRGNGTNLSISYLDLARFCRKCCDEAVPGGLYNVWSILARSSAAEVSILLKNLTASGDLSPPIFEAGKEDTCPPVAMPIPSIPDAKEAWEWLRLQRKPFYIDQIQLLKALPKELVVLKELSSPIGQKRAARDSAVAVGNGSLFVPSSSTTTKTLEADDKSPSAKKPKKSSSESKPPKTTVAITKMAYTKNWGRYNPIPFDTPVNPPAIGNYLRLAKDRSPETSDTKSLEHYIDRELKVDKTSKLLGPGEGKPLKTVRQAQTAKEEESSASTKQPSGKVRPSKLETEGHAAVKPRGKAPKTTNASSGDFASYHAPSAVKMQEMAKQPVTHEYSATAGKKAESVSKKAGSSEHRNLVAKEEKTERTNHHEHIVTKKIYEHTSNVSKGPKGSFEGSMGGVGKALLHLAEHKIKEAAWKPYTERKPQKARPYGHVSYDIHFSSADEGLQPTKDSGEDSSKDNSEDGEDDESNYGEDSLSNDGGDSESDENYEDSDDDEGNHREDSESNNGEDGESTNNEDGESDDNEDGKSDNNYEDSEDNESNYSEDSESNNGEDSEDSESNDGEDSESNINEDNESNNNENSCYGCSTGY